MVALLHVCNNVLPEFGKYFKTLKIWRIYINALNRIFYEKLLVIISKYLYENN